MIFDACAWAGDYPFGRLRHRTAEDILRLMDAAGIERALVSPLQGAFYRLCSEANEELSPGIAARADRLSLAAVINPCSPGWQDDLQAAQETMGAQAVRVIPSYHAYSLSDPRMGELAEAAAGVGLPVIVTLRLEDERGHPPAFQVPAAPAAGAARLAGEHPRMKTVISMARFGEIMALAPEMAGLANLWTDIAGAQGPAMCVEKLAEAAGAGRLLFGTGLPLQYALPARLKVEVTDLLDKDKAAILAGNARGVFAVE